MYAGLGLADAPAINYEELVRDGSFSFRLSGKEANRWVRGVNYDLEGCPQLASGLSGNTITVALTVSLSRTVRNMTALTVAVVQASSRAAVAPYIGQYYRSANIFFPYESVSSTVGEFIVFRTYADEALRVKGECTFERQTARIGVALKKGWNFVLVRREAASVVAVETVPGIPTQAKWFTFSTFLW